MRRRAYLAAASMAAVGLAGCTDMINTGGDPGSGDGDDDTVSRGNGSSGNYPDADAVGTDDDFEDLEAWSVSGGTLTADTDRALVGSQSARLEVSASEGATTLAKRFAEARDLTDVVPGVATAADAITVPWLRLLDGNGNSIAYRRGITPDLPLVRYNFGVETVSETFDAGDVREVQLQVWTADGDERTVWFDDLHFTPRPTKGKVMIQFDDNHVTDYTEALPVLEEYGYPAVTFVNPGRIEAETAGADDPGGFPRVDIDQLHELRDAGWTVANHCYNHPQLSNLDRDEQEAEIARGKEWLEAEGFDGARYFAYPHGDYDATTVELVEEYHDLGFAGGRPVQGYTTNPPLTSRVGEPSAERVRTEIKRTVEMRGITKVMYHRLEGEHLESFETLVETIDRYESKGKLEVILPRDVEERFLL